VTEVFNMQHRQCDDRYRHTFVFGRWFVKFSIGKVGLRNLQPKIVHRWSELPG